MTRKPQASPKPPAGDAADRSAPPHGAVAAALVEACAKAEGARLHVAADERAAERLSEIARAMAPELEVLLFPPWDCLAYDRASPSTSAQGRRVATLLAPRSQPDRARLVLASPEALVQRTLPPDTLKGLEHAVELDAPGEVERIVRFAWRTGYAHVEEVVEPGAICVRGEVIDVFSPAADRPCRLEIKDGRVTALHAFHPSTQLSVGEVDALTLTPASELIAPEADCDPAVFPEHGPRPVGIEHDLPRLSGLLASLLDHLPDAQVSLAPGMRARLDALADQIAGAFDTAADLAKARHASTPPRPDALYLDREAIAAALADARELAVEAESVPLFALAARPLREAAACARTGVEAGRTVVLAGAPQDLKRLAREMAKRLGQDCRSVGDWAAVVKAEAGSLLCLPVDIARGFRTEALVVITAQDVLGARAHHLTHATASTVLETEPDFRFGDVVIHEAHGVAVLETLETLSAGGENRPTARLEYHDGEALLVPAEELRHVWRYGADADAVTLDRLTGAGWAKRRAGVETSIAETARGLVELARTRDETPAPEIKPPRQTYERFLAGFPYPLTEDQGSAVASILEDMSAGRPMNRLVCGDVGFGKTEVALRAAAAAALSGRQVLVAAPTTVLARQHLETFRKRFEAVGLEVGHLSRLADAAEAKATKARLASGELKVVVGTHALAAKGVVLKDLGLLIIDEEQRFGAKLKDALHALGPQAHVLTLTATPIPRTLQGALVGIQDISVMVTPPARRRPVRTLVAPFTPDTVKAALERERARGGQSFVVTPRIEDIESLRAELAELAPDLTLLVAHGELPPEEVDEVMVRFAGGEGDVLLATNIIESGLDVPRANTMLVHHPDRFGLSQLHQLRGRVGRGRRQAAAYLLYDPAHPLSEAARERLDTLAAHDRLGSGFAISARDLDLRGAGDLVGEDQAGHLKLIGVGLYQQLLARAVRAARGEPVDERPEPELALHLQAELPKAYVPDAEVRLNLYARLSRLESAKAVLAFAHELEDRFGPLPAAAQAWIELARLRRLAHDLGISKLASGPKGVALDFQDAARPAQLAEGREDMKAHDARLVWTRPNAAPADIEHMLEELEAA